MTMNLTTAQSQALKAAIAANTNVITAALDPVGTFVGTAINAILPSQRSEEGAGAIAAWYNLAAAGPFFMFNTNIPLLQIAVNILWKVYTPVPVPDTTQLYTNVCNACQCDQMSVQNIFVALQGIGAFDASLKNFRQGLKDCTSAVPSGNSPTFPTNQDAGWTTNFTAIPGPLTRSATNFEALFAVASTGPLAGGTGALGSGGAQGVANVAVPGTAADGTYVQGPISFQDVFNAWSS